MKVTNTHGLPAILVKACENQRKPKPNSISCTELIDSPLVRKLKLEHWDSLEVDVSELVWAMTGTALHQMIEKHGDHESEVALSTEIGGYTLTGTCDHLTDDLISDWKTTSVWSVMLGNDWIDKVAQQLNIYRYMHYKMTGHLVPKLSACVFFRDWRRSEFKRNPSEYPPRNIMEIGVEAWSIEKVEAFILERFTFHHDDNYICTMAERWAKPDQWAVKKPNAARALRVFDTQIEAIQLNNASPGTEIEYRPGIHTRCDEYCPARTVCRFKINNEVIV